MSQSTYRRPSPSQKQFSILFAKADQPLTVDGTVEFIKEGDLRGNAVRVKLMKLDGSRFEGELPQGHYAAGNLPTRDQPGFITISFRV